MADASEHSTGIQDGRFGEKFDDEINAASVLWTTFWLAIVCVLGMAITWVMQGYFAGKAAAAKAPPSPIAEANERRLPSGPLLQNDPEGELEALRHEMAERLGSFGWVDESSGLVHIPIDEAMDLVVAQAGSSSAAAPSAPASEEQVSEEPAASGQESGE